LPVLTTVDAVTLPLDVYYATDRDRELWYQAVAILVQECMARHGFNFNPGTPSDRSMISHRYFLPFDLDMAQRVGYHTPPPTDAIHGTGMKSPTNSAERAVLYGSSSSHAANAPAGGCFGEAENRLARGTPQATLSDDGVLGMQNKAYGSAINDPRLVEAAKKWSTCMARAGYRYSNPVDAANSPVAMSSGQAQIEQAVTDVKCKQSTNYARIGFALMAAYEKLEIEAHAQQLELYQQASRAQAENAARVIAGFTGGTGQSAAPTG